MRSNPHRKWPTIDVVSIYSRGDVKGWNAMLRRIFESNDVQSLVRIMYGFQAGIADATKAGVVDDKMRIWFLRAQKSLENTAKKVFRKLYPSPLDDPKNKCMEDFNSAHAAKKKRDSEFERFLERSRF